MLFRYFQCLFQTKKGKNPVPSDDSLEMIPRERSGRQKKVITYTVSDEDSDSDF